MTKDQMKLLEENGLQIQAILAPPYGKGTKKLDDLSLGEVRTLLAYHLWDDGMETEDVQELLLGKNPGYQDHETIMNELVNTFGY